ncbi:MAG TPA: hypothetical protein VG408_05640, partial [Actinomycetota bacterium]|nr:hypothetical protein [Actinomycetota bacterium]
NDVARRGERNVAPRRAPNAAPERKGGVAVQRHETDALSLAFAIIFMTIGGLFMTGRVDAFDFISTWALPGVLVATGVVLAAVATMRYRRNREVAMVDTGVASSGEDTP